MVKAIGIRREDKNEWETRVPLTPDQVKTLVEREGITVEVQPSPIRTFPDKAYSTVGATLSEDLEASRIVLGIKHMPLSFFRPGGVYVFFSHTMKGQPYSMPMLKKIMEEGCTLIDRHPLGVWEEARSGGDSDEPVQGDHPMSEIRKP